MYDQTGLYNLSITIITRLLVKPTNSSQGTAVTCTRSDVSIYTAEDFYLDPRLGSQIEIEAPSTLYRMNMKMEVSLWKHIKCFPSTPHRRNLTNTSHFDLCLRKTWQGNHMITVTPSFSKSSVFKTFSIDTKTKSRCFQIPPVSGAPNRRKKAVFSNFSVVKWRCNMAWEDDSENQLIKR